MAKHNTRQQQFWSGTFGQGYNDRNTWTVKGFDQFYKKTWGTTRTNMNRAFLRGLKVDSFYETGANIGLQLRHLSAMGYDNLYGAEIQWDAVLRSRQITPQANIVQGSGFDVPFKDNFVDVAFTSGVLIHIHPKDQKAAMREMYRVSKKYIWGFEYFHPYEQEIPYRGNRNVLWKNDFPSLWKKNCPKLKLVKMKFYPYQDGSGNKDVMYLFKK